MLGDIVVKNEKDERNKLNSLDSHINRGFELMLQHHSRREEPLKPKECSLRFGKVLSLFSREIHFNFCLEIKKK